MKPISKTEMVTLMVEVGEFDLPEGDWLPRKATAYGNRVEVSFIRHLDHDA